MKPNIIFLVLDSLRAKSLLDFYSKAPIQTPGFSSFAQEATIYKYAFGTYAGSLPAHKSLFTGIYPSQNGAFGGDDSFLFKYYLPLILKKAGYTTACYSSCPILSDATDFNQGFDIFYKGYQRYQLDVVDDMLRKEFIRETTKLGKTRYLLKNLIKARFSKRTFKTIVNRMSYDATIVNSTPTTVKGINFIKKWVSDTLEPPFFIFVNFMQTHNDFNPPKPIRREFGLVGKFMHYQNYIYPHYCNLAGNNINFKLLHELYNAEIVFMDRLFQDLIDDLKKSNQYEETMIIVMGDHGEFLGEHGHVGHLFSLYNEVVHVPLIVKYPNRFKKGTIDKKLRQNHDIFHTICEMADSKGKYYNPDFSLLNDEGRDYAISQIINVGIIVNEFKQLYPNLDIENLIPTQALFSYIDKDYIKMIIGTDGILEIFDIKNDYEEEHNLVSKLDESVKEKLVKECELAQKKCGFLEAVENSKDQSYSLEFIWELKKLGYLPT